jgi:hypothetical protein
MTGPEITWQRCKDHFEDSQPCKGVAVHEGLCLAHLTPTEILVYVSDLNKAGTPLDGRGTHLSSERLNAVLEALVGEKDSWRLGKTLLPPVNFSYASFGDGSKF